MIPTIVISAVVLYAAWFVVRTIRSNLKGDCNCDHCPTKGDAAHPKAPGKVTSPTASKV